MTKRKSAKRIKRKTGRQTPVLRSEGIQVGDISGGTGFAIGHRAHAVVTQTSGATADEIALAFSALHQKVDGLPEGPDKSVAQKAVQALEAEARKGEQAAETQVQKWMNFLAETAPDAWEVAVEILMNPIKGVGMVFKKIADKAKSQQGAKKTDATKQ
jgi:hypothetical protein